MKLIIKTEKDKKLALEKLGQLPLETKTGKPIKYHFECTKINKKRTMSQNKYYFGVVLKIIASETGNDIEDLHEYFKQKYLGNKDIIVEIMGEKIFRPITTTELDTKLFMEYIEKIRSFASLELNCYIPDANEVPDYMYY